MAKDRDEELSELEGVEESEEDESEDAEDLAEELEALLTVAQLDLEAAAAYEVAIESVEDAGLQKLLSGFAEDHRRHAEDLREFVEASGGELEFPLEEPERSVLVALSAKLGALDPAAAVEALIANEQLTNGTYETALWLVTDDEAIEIVERNRADELRHLEVLLEYSREHARPE